MEDNLIEMGDYEIKCTPDRELWQLWDRLNASEKLFETLDELLDYMKNEIEHVVIEE